MQWRLHVTLFSDILPPKICNKIPVSTRARSCWRGLLTMFATLFWALTGSCPLFFVSVFATHISYTLFQTFIGPFLGPRGYCPLFSNFPSPVAYPYMFPTVSTFFRTSFFTLLNLPMIIEPPDDRRWTSRSARFYQHCAIKYTNIHGGTYSPRNYFQHTSPKQFFPTFRPHFSLPCSP